MQILESMPGMTYGCDPELFVKDPSGKFVGAEEFIPGTKDKPYPVPGGAVQVDGMAAEVNINPAKNFNQFNDRIVKVLNTLSDFLPGGYRLVALPSVVFDEDVWDKASDTAKMLGCSPDFNAWTGKVNPPPEDLDNPRMRTASGHLHIGWRDGGDATEAGHLINCRDLAKQLDYYLGAWSISHDADTTRRRLYGKAGAVRYKSYGVEYRVLSNFWVTSPVYRLMVWNRMVTAINDMRNNFLPDRSADFNDRVIKSINDSELDADLMKTFAFPLVGINDED